MTKKIALILIGVALLMATLVMSSEPVREKCYAEVGSYLIDGISDQALARTLNGDLKAAKNLYMIVLVVQEKTLGLSDVNLAKTLNNLSSVCLSMRELEQAAKFSERALQILKNRYSEYDPVFIDSYLRLAQIYDRQGDIERSLQCIERACSLGACGFVSRETRFGPGSYIANERLFCTVPTLIAKKDFSGAEQVIKRLAACEYEMFGDTRELQYDLQLLSELFKASHRSLEAQKLMDLLSSGAKLTRRNLEPYMLPKPLHKDLLFHPILKSMAGHGLDGIRLPDSAFYRLNGAVFTGNVQSYKLRQFFERSEVDALESFCTRVVGLSKSQVEALAGRPKFKGGQVSCWSFSRPDEDVWVYRLGYLRLAAHLTFANDKCIQSKVCTAYEDHRFQEWRASEMVRWAQGKSMSQILKALGLPYCCGDWGQPPGPTGPAMARTFHFDSGPSTYAALTIKNGVCTAGSVGPPDR